MGPHLNTFMSPHRFYGFVVFLLHCTKKLANPPKPHYTSSYVAAQHLPRLTRFMTLKRSPLHCFVSVF
jgi:hypothetical protein